MDNFVLSPINADTLIQSISDKVTENILQFMQTDFKPDAQSDEYLTPKEASELLKISLVTLWRYEKKGKVKCYGIGGTRLYKRSELIDSLSVKK